MATINPSTTIVPSIACKGITTFELPPFRIPNSTNRITADMIKQRLQMNTILEKKRKGLKLFIVNGEKSMANWELSIGKDNN